MKKAFENLKKISSDYRAFVDGLTSDYQGQSGQDHLYSDEIKAKLLAERNAAFNAKIDSAAQKAAEMAAVEIAKLRTAMQEYITDSTDSATIQTLQALLSAGVELSTTEINAFAAKGGYGVLRLLSKPSKGHIQAPKPDQLETDLKKLESYFKDISAYRGELSSIGTNSYWGRTPVVGSVIMRGQIDSFAKNVDEIAKRWDCIVVENCRNDQRA